MLDEPSVRVQRALERHVVRVVLSLVVDAHALRVVAEALLRSQSRSQLRRIDDPFSAGLRENVCTELRAVAELAEELVRSHQRPRGHVQYSRKPAEQAALATSGLAEAPDADRGSAAAAGVEDR